MEGHWKFRGEGGLKAKIFIGKYDAKLEFSVGWESLSQKTFCGVGMAIFWNNTIMPYSIDQKSPSVVPSIPECQSKKKVHAVKVKYSNDC